MTPNIFLSSSSAPFTRSSRKGLYRKELISTGVWHKGKHKWEVDEALLSHWVDTHHAQVANGLKVTVPLEHTNAPDKNRGYLIDLEVTKNDRGVPALFGFFKFPKEHQHLTKTTDVSIYSPTEYTDGKNNKYVRPIRHVALTTDPVVTGLGPFEPIAASFGEPEMTQLQDIAKELKLSLDDDAAIRQHILDMSMSMRSLAKKLRITVADDADDTTVESAIASAFSRARGKARDAKKGAKDGDKKDGKDGKENIAASQPQPGMVRLLRDNRKMKLDALVASGHVTPAARKRIDEAYCTDEALAMSLSNEGESDPFDMMLSAIEVNGPVLSLKEKTGGQAIALSKVNNDNNPVLRDAKARAERAKAHA